MGILQIIVNSLNEVLPLSRILVLGVIFTVFIWSATQKNSGMRGVIASLEHVVIVSIGWFVGKWSGIFLLSAPLLVFYYYLLFHFAMVIVPTAVPESWDERRLRFKYFLLYHWGFQYPTWVVPDSSGANIEQRIKGSFFNRNFAPGLFLAQSHQVVGLTSGITFSGVDGPGVVFTKAFQRPYEVVDLRTQLRTAWIDVVSSDGIPYRALLFTSFAVDHGNWSRELYHKLLKTNLLLKDGQEPDATQGSYPFSRPRLKALFSTIGISFSREKDEKEEEPEKATWDARILYQIEQAAQEILSQKRLDELWITSDDRQGENAMDAIARAITDQCSFSLLQRGIRIYAARIVSFEFSIKPKAEELDGDVLQQQLKVWSADWQREAARTRAEGEAEAAFLMHEARAYAYATLLTALAEGMQKTRQIDPDLLPRVIAMRFIGALEKMVKQQPVGIENQEAYSTINGIKQLFNKNVE